MKVGFIGGGAMASAIIDGILRKGIARAGEVRVGEPVEERRRSLEERFGVGSTPSNLMAVDQAELLVLAVLPQQLPGVMRELNGHLPDSQTVLSIIAGATIHTLSQGLAHPAVVRAMPNNPARIGMGMSVWTSAPAVGRAAREMARSVLGSVGEELYVDNEELINMATALSASGPAYVFLFIEALIDAGVHIGMPREMAQTLVLQTLMGSTAQVRESGRHPAELRNAVTSPGGTTAEALLKLEEGGVRAAVLRAVIAAYEKSRALGRPRD